MAFTPQYQYSDFITFCNYQPPLGPEIAGASPMLAHQGGFPFFDNIGDDQVVVLQDVQVPPENDIIMPLPERFGVSDMAVPELSLPELSTGIAGGGQRFEFGGYNYQQQDMGMCEFGEEYCCNGNGVVLDFPLLYPSSNDNWGFKVSQVPVMEEPTLKVGKYSVEERKDRILRYLKKRNQRNFNKTIKYECRKTLADKRVRVRGRFAKNNEQCEEQAFTKKNNNNPHEVEEFYNDETIKIEHEGEDWLQEAMASLMYFSNISG